MESARKKDKKNDELLRKNGQCGGIHMGTREGFAELPNTVVLGIIGAEIFPRFGALAEPWVRGVQSAWESREPCHILCIELKEGCLIDICLTHRTCGWFIDFTTSEEPAVGRLDDCAWMNCLLGIPPVPALIGMATHPNFHGLTAAFSARTTGKNTRGGLIKDRLRDR